MPAAWRPMTEPERRAIQSLGSVTFPVASPPKRLARHLLAQAEAAEPVITDRQAVYLWRVVHTFRRQIPADIRALAPATQLPQVPSTNLASATFRDAEVQGMFL